MTSYQSGRKRRLSSFILVALLSLSLLSLAQNRNGRLLQGEKWQKFENNGTHADFYVSPKGNDHWSGTLPEPNSAGNDGPFATLDRAQKAVRELKSQVFKPKEAPVEKRWIGSPHPYGKGKDILVLLRGGHYFMEHPLVFNPADGGERIETNLPTGAFEYHKIKDHYVTYAAYPGEIPVISGGQPIVGWKVRKGIWSAPLATDSVSMFMVDGVKQTLARKPNTGYFIPTTVSRKTDEFSFRKGDLEPWKELAGNRIIMLLRWHTGINSLATIDPKNGMAYLKAPQEGIVIVPPRYYIENLKALLDTSGEWYYDKKAREISYIPQKNQPDPNRNVTSIGGLKELIVVTGERGNPVRNLRFYGLTLEGTEAGSSAVSYEFAHACELVESEVRAIGGTAVSVKAGCYQTRILGNQITNADHGGILVNGTIEPIWQSISDFRKGLPSNPNGDSPKIIRETLISYNKVSDCGGISIYANNTLGTEISHNYVTRTRGRYGIDVGGWSNQEDALDGNYRVEYNHLEDVQQDADDSGAIKTAGMVFNSIVRRNLIHRVHAGFFNDNVGFWFDNMSQGWVTEENIYYDLEQGEMKYCAAQPEDNIYRNNFKIETPANAPETIIDGLPDLRCSQLQVTAPRQADGSIEAGGMVQVSASVFNQGATGTDWVLLYVDGKIHDKMLFPVVKNNARNIQFALRIYDAGEHTVSIGNTPQQKLMVKGEKPAIVFENLQISANRCLAGEPVVLKALIRNLTSESQQSKGTLYIDDHLYKEDPITLGSGEERTLELRLIIPAGNHTLRLGNSASVNLLVQPGEQLNLKEQKIWQYGSPRSKPFAIEADAAANRFKIAAAGSDFYHAEDAYAAAYVKGVKGDFVATVTLSAFGERTHEWFRSGLFVRNDIAKSFDVMPGSKGSVLLFGTPGRAGIEYDEFANGCMHKASSQNLPEHSKTPIYLKLVRHGNSFSGYVSLDGTNWILEKHSTDIPGIAESVDLGLAAGGPDTRQYWVEFKDWKIEVAK
ncbi:MAG: right-handed parallel beta-helix repeat-containing protein [Marinilabiliales bacterium]|nr:right-handed parallel beta-helix repeat-containing protein [Marinilabiliales bacterium]